MRLKNKLFITLIVSIVLISGFITFKIISYKSLQVNNIIEMDLEKLVQPYLKNNSEIELSKVIPFDWDEIYIFEPYSSNGEIYSTVGVKWISANTTFFEYILNIDRTGLYRDHLKKIVFLKNKKVIYDKNYNKYIFDFSQNYYLKENQVFNVKRKNNTYLFILNMSRGDGSF
ncbi:hypothetical protein [Paramaledivibacter caminithermalis]|jgi:hypothetical protein|uniref:Uncharacterized protein n=1 Tax=Paramaledivibacter caminithermalis (strain DSM 15212 / CIP 107654 / DViRD3) TaxID=1121301 RepID=A0A1M6P3C0_PARC5|nr:hypothetical protein [Paramaledivibacter caminithermalis]SHK02396.1 hypothetical protein SAMN02745912_01992 [Paramaledivibacter caminithermalis DSM 15212]